MKRLQRAKINDRGAEILDRHFSLYGWRPIFASVGNKGLQVVHFHGPWAAESEVSGGSAMGNWLKRKIEQRRYASADLIIVLSESFKELLVRAYGVPPAKVRVIAPGVRVASPGIPTFRRESGPERPVVLCVRRLERRMGIGDLLQAWRRVLEAHPDAKLRIVGEGTEGANLRSMSKRLGLEASVQFLGRLSDEALDYEYARSDLTVVPTRALEGFGLIALESLARGKAPVVTNCGGLPDSVRGLDGTLVVEPASPEQLAGRLISALAGERPSEEECLRHAEKFTWREAARAHIEVYKEFLASR